jgi:hydroxyacylglutathione hydrolase
VHADFVSGGRELAAGGARLLAPAGSGLSFGQEELRDGEDLDLGGLMLRALATPGHTPEHLSYLLLDGGQPVAVFTGGALIVGGVARTDLADPARGGLDPGGLPLGPGPAWPARRSGGLPDARARVVLLGRGGG